MTALPAPHCFSFSLFYTLYPHALSHALARASPYCSPSHVIVLSAHCFPMYLTSLDRHLETLVSTSCLQVSPHVLRSVDTSLNTLLSPALPVEPSSSLAAQRPARRSCLSRSASPLRSTPSRNNVRAVAKSRPSHSPCALGHDPCHTPISNLAIIPHRFEPPYFHPYEAFLATTVHSRGHSKPARHTQPFPSYRST